MNFVNAELAKISVNTYVTTKIAYANMLARICEQLPGADVDVVTRRDRPRQRIGAKYLRGDDQLRRPVLPARQHRACDARANARRARVRRRGDRQRRIATGSAGSPRSAERAPDGGVAACSASRTSRTRTSSRSRPASLLARRAARAASTWSVRPGRERAPRQPL